MLALFLVLGVLFGVLTLTVRSGRVRGVPVVGSTLLFGYVGAIRGKWALRDYLLEGRIKYASQPFQIPILRSWLVCVSGSYIHELRNAPRGTLSFQASVNDAVAAEYMLDRAVHQNHRHVPVVRRHLTAKLPVLFPAIQEEVGKALNEILPSEEDGVWHPVCMDAVSVGTVSRASNRVFVGIDLCRLPRFNELSGAFMFSFIKAGFLISHCPKFIRSLMAWCVTSRPAAQVRELEAYLVPLVEKRLSLDNLYGPRWEDRPVDMLQWLIDSAEGEERSPKRLAIRILTLIVTATHTTSMTFTHAIYYLAANPQHAVPLRQEVTAVVNDYGWSMEGVAAMLKIDSFLKETLRCSGFSAISMQRKVLKPFSFADGTTLPAGSHVYANLWAVHHDPSIYPEPYAFDPFRFSRAVEAGESQAKHSLTTASAEFLTWGYGPWSCAGRHMAGVELKTMLAYIVMHYDLRMPENGVRPADRWFAQACIPDRGATVLFKRRSCEEPA